MTRRTVALVARTGLPRLAVVAAVAVLGQGIAARSSAAPAGEHVTQTSYRYYTLESTWRSVDPPNPIRSLAWPPGHEAGGVGIDVETGRLLATDRTAGTIRSYGPDGRFVAEVGRAGSGPGELAAPRDVAVVPGGQLAVTDTGNDRVQVLAADGTFVRSWPVADPQGIVFDGPPGDEALYVVSRAVDRLDMFSPLGGLRDEFELPKGSAAEGLAFVEAPLTEDGGAPRPLARLAVAAPGHDGGALIDLAARHASAVMALPGVRAVALEWPGDTGEPKTAAPLSEWRTFAGGDDLGVLPVIGAPRDQVAAVPIAGVTDLALSPDGALYVAAGTAGLLSLGDGAALVPWMTGLGRLAGPARIAAGDAVVVGDRWPRIGVWRMDGQPVSTIPLRLAGRGSVHPTDVAALAGAWFVLTSDGTVRRLAPGAPPSFWGAGDGVVTAPVAIAAHDGVVAVADLARQEVVLLSEGLVETARWPIDPGAFHPVTDLAISADAVFLADREASAVRVYDRDGAPRPSIAASHGVMRLAATPEGDVVVLSPIGWAFAYAPDGTALGAWPVTGGTGHPTDLAFDAQGRLYVADAGDAVRVYRPEDTITPPDPPESATQGCRLTRDKTAAPAEIDLGATVEVRLTVDGACEREARASDVVLAIDVSGSMQFEGKITAARSSAIAFVAQMDPATTRVGVVAFQTTPQLVQPLTSDRALLIERIGALAAGGGTNIQAALAVSTAALAAAAPRPDAKPAIVLLTDGRTNSADGLEEAIAGARAAGVEVFTIGLGSDADRDTLARIATDGSHAFFTPTIDELQTLYAEIGRRLFQPDLFARVTVVDQVPGNMTYLGGSGRPIEPAVSPDGRTLTWSATALGPRRSLDLAYRVRPTQPGRWPTNVEAHAEYVDGLGTAGRAVFPVPLVTVRAPQAAWLPVAVSERCTPAERPNGIALVMDCSNSMAERSGDTTKLAAARSAARAFVGRVALGRDRVAVVAFSAGARLVQPLTSDTAAVLDALDHLALSPGTGIAAAIDVATVELTGPRGQPDDHRVLVLLTDGRSNPEPSSAGVARAEAAREAGITIFAIGLGDDVDEAALSAIAGAPERYFRAPTAADLADVYRRIALRVPCPPAAFWARR
jgi:Mg-chelatase subunit ChlD